MLPADTLQGSDLGGIGFVGLSPVKIVGTENDVHGWLFYCYPERVANPAWHRLGRKGFGDD
jgi:hypothetical protein